MKDLSIYLDYAAATPMDEEVKKVMEPYFSLDFYNPSADYLKAKKVLKNLNQARSTVAQLIGSKPAEIIFTAGATEANNLAIRGVMDSFPSSNLIYSTIEHDSVIEPSKLYHSKVLGVNNKGIIEPDKLLNLIDDKT